MEEATQDSNKKKVFLPIVVILILIVGVLMVIRASVQKESRLNAQPIEMVEGAEVPNFQLTALDGSKKALGDFKSKVVLLNFWASWCEACIEEMPSMVALRDKHASKGFEIIGINVDENPNEAVPSITKTMKISFPVFIDPGSAISEMFDVHAIPLSVMINADRKILMIESGGRDWNDEETNQLVQKWLSD